MIVFLDGELLPLERARISPLDRSFLFGDGVYEGLRASAGHVIAIRAHVERLRRSMRAIRLRGVDPEVIVEGSFALLEANGLEDSFLYWQVSRGAPGADAPVRGRLPEGASPCVFGYATALSPIDAAGDPPARTCALIEDPRWRRNDVKSTSLLGSVLPAIEASERGAEDAILHRDGMVTEATSANVFVVRDGRVRTPSLGDGAILAGVTRDLILSGVPEVEEGVVRVEEALAAEEIILAGTTTMVTSVVALDGRPVGGGASGAWAKRLHAALIGAIERDRASAGRTLRS